MLLLTLQRFVQRRLRPRRGVNYPIYQGFAANMPRLLQRPKVKLRFPNLVTYNKSRALGSEELGFE